jgi:stringent starvation protein B
MHRAPFVAVQANKANMAETSTKPYLLRAIYEWCTDNGYTPYLAAMADGRAQVPREFVKNGEIVLNISFTATSGLKMDNDFIRFSARFGGAAREIVVPVENVLAIYARENGQGMAFEAEKKTDAPVESSGASIDKPAQAEAPHDHPNPPKPGGRPALKRIK